MKQPLNSTFKEQQANCAFNLYKEGEFMAIKVGSNFQSMIEKQGYITASAAQCKLSVDEQEAFSELQKCWNNLELDKYYGEAHPSNYRIRRYSDFIYVPTTGELHPKEHVAYYQSERQNSYAGGKTRHFGDILPETYENTFLQDLVKYDFNQFPIPEEYLDQDWICQIHMIRIVVGHN